MSTVVAVVAAAGAGAEDSASASAGAGAATCTDPVGAGAAAGTDPVGAGEAAGATPDMAGAGEAAGAGAIPDTAGVDITQATLITDMVIMDATDTIEAEEAFTEQEPILIHWLTILPVADLIWEIPVEFAPIQEQEQTAEGLISAVEGLQQPGVHIDLGLRPGAIG